MTTYHGKYTDLIFDDEGHLIVQLTEEGREHIYNLPELGSSYKLRMLLDDHFDNDWAWFDSAMTDAPTITQHLNYTETGPAVSGPTYSYSDYMVINPIDALIEFNSIVMFRHG